MSWRPGRKLQNLNVWQRGIEHYRGGQRDLGSAAGGAPAQRGWAKSLFRRLLGRRASGAPATAHGVKGLTLSPLEPLGAGHAAVGGGAPTTPSPASAARATSVVGDQRPEIREGMLSRRAVLSAHSLSPASMTHLGAVNVAGCRDLRLWQRGREFVAAATGGFDPGGSAEYLAERRAMWRQRSQRRVAGPARLPASQAAVSLRLLLRAVAARSGKGEASPVPVGSVAPAGLSRRTVPSTPPRTVVAAAGPRQSKTFRDHKIRQQGANLLEKALRARQKQSTSQKPLDIYRPAGGGPQGTKSPDQKSPH